MKYTIKSKYKVIFLLKLAINFLQDTSLIQIGTSISKESNTNFI